MPLSADDLNPDVWDDAAAAAYDNDSAGMFEASVLGPTVEFLRSLAGEGPVLEFAIGTGRVAVPLVEAGLRVAGIEFSEAMASQLRAKPRGGEVDLVIGDMATARIDGSFTLVYLVYNTITNLLSQEQQMACFVNAAAHLAPGGAFVIEVGVPSLRRLAEGERYRVFDATDDHLGVDEIDTAAQLLVSHHYWFEPDGSVRRFDSPHRYVWPSELDVMALHAGLRLESRFADWSRAPFTDTSTSHVSVWRKPA